MAAVTDEPDSGHTLTEADWNAKSSLDRNPYYYSKTLAEKSAWDFMAQRKPLFDLVAINPFMVVGPSLTSALNTSNQIFVDLLKGTYPGILSLTWGFVDVRDVADAHVRALGTPSAHGRYLCAGDTLSMRGLVALLGRERLRGIQAAEASARFVSGRPAGSAAVIYPGAGGRFVPEKSCRTRAQIRHVQDSNGTGDEFPAG